MPSHSRALEASFESSDKPAVPLGSDPGPMLEDFDSFFEKLNNLDGPELRKSDSPPPSKPLPATGTKVPSSPARKPPITPSAPLNVDPLAGLRAAFAQARKAQAAESGNKPSRRRSKVAVAVRFALTALVLFAGGMGIGWAALSLPGKITETGKQESSPAKGLIVEQKADALLTKPAEDKSAHQVVINPLVETAPGSVPKAESPVKPDQGAVPSETVAPATLPVDVAAKLAVAKSDQTAGDKKPDSIQVSGTQVEPGAGGVPERAADPLAVAGEEKPHDTPVRIIHPASARPTETAGAVATTDAAGGTRYAVQVGACRSTRCVDSYRKLISAHLSSPADQIHIVAVPSQGKEVGVQRVRVAPLDKAQAQQLRASLIQADPRLSEAYVVEFHP